MKANYFYTLLFFTVSFICLSQRKIYIDIQKNKKSYPEKNYSFDKVIDNRKNKEDIGIIYKIGLNNQYHTVSLNEGWQISFRIHNASSRVEPSLKFDINLVSAPHSLFTNHLFLNK